MHRRYAPALLAMTFAAASGGAGQAPATEPAGAGPAAVAPAASAQVTVYKSPT